MDPDVQQRSSDGLYYTFETNDEGAGPGSREVSPLCRGTDVRLLDMVGVA